MAGVSTELPFTTDQTDSPDEDGKQTPDVSFDESADTATLAETDQAEDQGEPEAPDPLAALQSKIDALEAQIQAKPAVDPEAVRQQERERLRIEQQIRQQEEQREQSDREELNESIAAALISAGYTDAKPESVRKVSERFINKRYDQIANRTAGEVRDALKWIQEYAENGSPTSQLSGRSAQYAGQLADSFNGIYQKLQEQARDSSDLTSVSADDLVKRLSPEQVKSIADKEIARRNAQTRNGTKPLKRVEGTAETGDELSWWKSLTPEGRKDPANIARFDRYTASRR